MSLYFAVALQIGDYETKVLAQPRHGHRLELELSGPGNGWTDVSQDLIETPGIRLEYGISGTGPLDLLASTGQLSFTLNNSETNTGGTAGYYSPQHASCRPGFALGIGVRYHYKPPNTSNTDYRRFLGRLKRIAVVPGRFGDRKTICGAVDWMDEAANFKPNVATQTNKRGDEVLTTLLAAMPRPPANVDFDAGDSTFPYSLDNSRSEANPLTTEIQRICQSEYARCYIRGSESGAWGTLRLESRTARLTPSPVASFLGTMQGLQVSEDTAKARNKAKVTAHPRRVDASDTRVLFAKPNQSNPSVNPGQTITITGRYTDPDTPNARVGGIDMKTPVATTDYLMNSLADGSGTNLTANFAVVATYGANQVEYEITNNGGTPGFVTKLQARGRALYDYDPIDAFALDQDSIDLVGESPVALDMPYQSDVAIAAAVAEFIVLTWVAPGPADAKVRFIPRDLDELLVALSIEPGDPIAVTEELTGVNGVYFVQGLEQAVEELGEKVTFEWTVQRALVQDYWQLGVSGFSELGVTTVLAPL